MEEFVNIIVANVQPRERSTLVGIIKKYIDHATVLEAQSLCQINCILSSENVALALVDCDLPDFDDVAKMSHLQMQSATTAFVMVGEDPSRKAVIDSLGLGAQGYLLKRARASEVGEALHTVLSGRIYFPPLARPDPGGQNGERALPSASQAPVAKLFTGRQLDVLMLMAKGYANKVIGRELNITENTVKIHLRAAFRVLGVHRRRSAIEALASLNMLPDKKPNNRMFAAVANIQATLGALAAKALPSLVALSECV